MFFKPFFPFLADADYTLSFAGKRKKTTLHHV